MANLPSAQGATGELCCVFAITELCSQLIGTAMMLDTSIKTGKAIWPSPFPQRVFETRWKRLEAEPDSKLHLPGVIALTVDNTEGRRRGWINALGKERGVRICEHRMVEHVGYDILERQADAFYDMKVFHHS